MAVDATFATFEEGKEGVSALATLQSRVVRWIDTRNQSNKRGCIKAVCAAAGVDGIDCPWHVLISRPVRLRPRDRCGLGVVGVTVCVRDRVCVTVCV